MLVSTCPLTFLMMLICRCSEARFISSCHSYETHRRLLKSKQARCAEIIVQRGFQLNLAWPPPAVCVNWVLALWSFSLARKTHQSHIEHDDNAGICVCVCVAPHRAPPYHDSTAGPGRPRTAILCKGEWKASASPLGPVRPDVGQWVCLQNADWKQQVLDFTVLVQLNYDGIR